MASSLTNPKRTGGIGVKFEHRRYSVVAVKNPKGGVSFFIMSSMMFGSNAAVPNYNRRAMLLTKILRVAFRIPLYNYFDDKFCRELKATSTSALECIIHCHRMWGMLYGEDKIQHGPEITILGVGFDFRHMVIDLTTARRAAFLQEIHEASATDRLTPGTAAKVKGKIYFTIEHQFGKCGRHLLRPLSEQGRLRHDTGRVLQEGPTGLQYPPVRVCAPAH